MLALLLVGAAFSAWWLLSFRGGLGQRARVVLLTALDAENRPDAILLVCTSPRSTRIIAIPRDWQIADGMKLNGKAKQLGPKAFKRYLQDLLRIRIDHYMAVPFSQRLAEFLDCHFREGLAVQLDRDIEYHDFSGNIHYHVPRQPGHSKTIYYDGMSLLWICRDRSSSKLGDAVRITRVKLVAECALSELAKPSALPRIPGMARDFLQLCENDFGVEGLTGVLTDAARSRDHFTAERLPGKPVSIHGTEYVLINPAQACRMVRLAVSGTPIPDKLRIVVENASTVDGLASAMAKKLYSDYGLRSEVGNAANVFSAVSTVEYAPASLKPLASYLASELGLKAYPLDYATAEPTMVFRVAHDKRSYIAEGK